MDAVAGAVKAAALPSVIIFYEAIILMRSRFITSKLVTLGAAMMILALGIADRTHAQAPPEAAKPALDFDTRHARDAANNPADLDFTLRLLEGKTQFHMGEVIPLEATFLSHTAKKYRINAGYSGRDVPWANEDIVFDRDLNTVDPSLTYFEPDMVYSIPGNAFEWTDVDDKPQTTKHILNEWRRFDQPGVYRIYMRSARVQLRKASGAEAIFGGSLKAASNILQIEILPDDPEWSAQQLAHALSAFPIEKRNLPESWKAARTLRFLDTQESIQAIIEHYADFTLLDTWSSSWHSEGRLGLLGSRQTPNAATLMAAKIEDRDFPIIPMFIKDLVQLQTVAQYSHSTAEPPPSPTAARAALRQRTVIRNAFLQQDLKRLRAALPQKRGAAAVHSAFTLFDDVSADRLSLETQKAIAPILISHFEILSAEEQSRLLDDNCWPGIRSPRMTPHLRRLFQQLQVDLQQGVYEIDRRSLVLKRLYELAPTEGRRIILAEIQQPYPQITTEVLGSLPDATLPKLSRKLVAMLSADSDRNTVAFLIHRYGTADILPSVAADYQNNQRQWECPTCAALLAYFLRVAPQYGAREIKTLLHIRQDGCVDSILSDLATLHPTGSQDMPAPLQQIVIATLSDPDRDISSSAAKALGAYGAPSAKPVLWRRLHLLRARGANPIADGSLAIVAAAIATAPAWLTNHAELKQLQSLFPNPNALADAGVWSVDHGDRIFLSADSITSDGRGESWRVGQYQALSRTELKRKLAQYPQGTTFHLTHQNTFGNAQTVASALDDIKAFLKLHGMVLITR